MTLDRAAFFAAVRASFGALKQGQVDGINSILDQWEARGGDDRHFAYMLATAWHETDRTMRPIKEYGGEAYFTKMYDIKGSRPEKARELGNLTPGDGIKYCGRGYVQLTGRDNYARASKAVGKDLIGKPDLAMEPDIAARIMFAGMIEGWFTGKKLSDFNGGGQEFDAKNARRIINGTDQTDKIAGYYRQFLRAILASHAPPSTNTPASPPSIQPASSGFFIALLKALFTAFREKGSHA